jgi:hypothetical protein
VFLAAGHFRKNVLHFALEEKAVVKDSGSTLEFCDIGRAGFIEVRIDAGAHEGLHFDAIAAHLFYKVSHHCGGGGDRNFARRGRAHRRTVPR